MQQSEDVRKRLALCRKKSKSTLEALEEDLALKPNNGRPRMAAPPGVERFSDGEDDTGDAILNTEWESADYCLCC